MRFLGSLFAAYSVLWIAIFFYLLRLTRRSRQVEDEVEALRRTLPARGSHGR
jgi:CcmD family protein